MVRQAATPPPWLLTISTTAFTQGSFSHADSFSLKRATGFSPSDIGPENGVLRIRPSTSITATRQAPLPGSTTTGFNGPAMGLTGQKSVIRVSTGSMETLFWVLTTNREHPQQITSPKTRSTLLIAGPPNTVSRGLFS